MYKVTCTLAFFAAKDGLQGVTSMYDLQKGRQVRQLCASEKRKYGFTEKTQYYLIFITIFP